MPKSQKSIVIGLKNDDKHISNIRDGVDYILKQSSTSHKDVKLQKHPKTHKAIVITVQNDAERPFDVKEVTDEDESNKVGLDKEKTVDNIELDMISSRRKGKQIQHKISSVQNQHAAHVEEIHEFMLTNRKAANYFYDESLRIFTFHDVYDSLRKMMRFVGEPTNINVKFMVLQCFLDLNIHIATTKNPWRFDTNNFIIDDLDNKFDGAR